MNEKIRVGIVFGGRSAEHEVSLQSAKNIIASLDSEKYVPVLIGIDRNGRWFLNDSTSFLLNETDPKNIKLESKGNNVALIASDEKGRMFDLAEGSQGKAIDVLFPVLHGPYGEDGSIQGLAKLANLPCVGSGILGSAVGMDKEFTKRLLMTENILIANYVVVRSNKLSVEEIQTIETSLGYPVFVKPANMGSSVGVSKALNLQELKIAVAKAAQFDSKILIEENIVGREIECAVLGNSDPIASVPGEIIPQVDFYDYESKYIDEAGAKLQIPANVDEALSEKIRSLSLKVFKTLECRGMSRVDMFVTDENEIYINEVNTIPGFTKISMYPKLWSESGMSYKELIDRLITLSIEEFEIQSNYKSEI